MVTQSNHRADRYESNPAREEMPMDQQRARLDRNDKITRYFAHYT